MSPSATPAPNRSHWIADLRWARDPQQERSKRTRAALLDAAEAELDTSSIEELSVADIAERADASIGSVYHHFKNKQALIYAMLDRLTDEWLATTGDATDPERWAGASIPDVVRGYLEFSIDHLRSTEGVTRAKLQLTLEDPEVAAQQEKAAAHMNERIHDLLWARRSEIGRRKKAQAIAFVLDQMAAMLHARIAMPGVAINTGSDDEFVGLAVESVAAYLQLR